MSVTLGFLHHTHDAAACLLAPDRFLAAVEEERVNRDKHTSAFPHGALDACFGIARLPFEAVDRVAYPWRPDRRALHGLAFVLRNLPGSLRVLLRRGDGDVFRLLRLPARLRDHARSRGRRAEFTRFHFVDHHLAHACYAWFTSPFERALILTHDFCGETDSVLAALGEGDRIRPLFRLAYPDSLGFVYSAVTKWLGFLRNSDEGKVMGLSPYGDERFVPDFRAMVELLPDGRFRLDRSWFDIFFYDLLRGGESPLVSPRFLARFGPPRGKDEPLLPRHRAVARALQELVERVTLHMVGTLARAHRVDAVCLSGGVALNACANGRLLRDGVVRRLHAPPAAGDAGAALGAALFVRKAILRQPGRVAADPYLGREYGEREIRAALAASGLPARPAPDPVGGAVERLAAGKVVAVFRGRMEFGPRALGNRSILADARDPGMRDRLNLHVKHRELFRPYAPAVTLEAYPRFFRAAAPSPWMLQVHPVREEMREVVPSIVHVDGSARVQTVARGENPAFHRLLERFGEATGVPLLLNTSFNDRGEPIVESPDDALAFFLRSSIDALLLGDFLIDRPGTATA